MPSSSTNWNDVSSFSSVLMKSVSRVPWSSSYISIAAGPAPAGSRPPTHQPIAEPRQVRGRQPCSQPLRQPLQEMRLLVGAHFDGMDHLDHEGAMRRDRLVGHDGHSVGSIGARKASFASHPPALPRISQP